METTEATILCFAIFTRITLVLIQLVSNLLIPDHDAEVFNPPLDRTNFGVADKLVHLVFGGLRRWDAVYFTHIMEHGYTYENCVAFFPFFPCLVASLANIFSFATFLHLSSRILLMSVVVNFVVFCATAVGLYRLGKVVIKDECVAYYSALLFCINPASIFMTAPYSEALYFFTLVYALNGLHANAKYAASFLIGLGVFTRSNGTIGTGFVLHDIARSFLSSSHYLYVLHKQKHKHFPLSGIVVLGLKALLDILVCITLCFLPFFIFQYYTYVKFCQPLDPAAQLDSSIMVYGRVRGYHILGDPPSPWCYDTLPMSYSYIQQEHWGVGFFKYYTWQQLPNFFLALPIICLSLHACKHFLSLDRNAAFTLGLWDGRAQALHRRILRKKLDSFEYEEDDDGSGEPTVDFRKTESNCQGKQKTIVWSPLNFRELFQPKMPQSLEQTASINDTVVFSIHLIFLVIFGCCFVHIQVLTRLLCSSSPLLYWYCGALYTSQCQATHNGNWNQNSFSTKNDSLGIRRLNIITGLLKKLRLHFLVEMVNKWENFTIGLKCIIIYFVGYFIIGTVMFSNFLPWT